MAKRRFKDMSREQQIAIIMQRKSNKKNRYKTVYHSTVVHKGKLPIKSISDFDYGGLHVGTLKASRDRIALLNEDIKDAVIYKINLDTKRIYGRNNPVGEHTENKFFLNPSTKKGKKAAYSLKGLYDTSEEDPNEPYPLMFSKPKKKIKKRSTGIAYKNTYEDKNKVSYVVWDPRAIKKVVKLTLRKKK